MNLLFEVTTRFSEKVRKLGQSDMTLEAVNAQFDPTEFVKTRPVRQASQNFLEMLERYLAPDFLKAFDKTPESFQHSACNIISEAGDIIDSVLNGITKHVNREVSRTSEREYAQLAKQIAEKQAALFEKFKGITSVEFQNERLQELSEVVNERFLQMAKLEEKLSMTTKDAFAAFAASKEKVTLAERIRDHRKGAVQWLIAFAMCCIVTVGYILWIVRDSSSGATMLNLGIAAHLHAATSTSVDLGVTNKLLMASVVGTIASKMLLASFAIGLCVITGRFYQTHIHNEIVCKQRLLASDLFVTLYQSLGANDSEGKTELIRQAAQSILAHTSTGFLHKGGNELAPLIAQLPEIAKKTAP